MYKSIKVIYDSVIEDEIIAVLKKAGVRKFIIVPKVEGCWSSKVKHMDTHVWPGTDSVLFFILEKDKAVGVIEAIRSYKENLKVDVPINAVVSPVEEII